MIIERRYSGATAIHAAYVSSVGTLAGDLLRLSEHIV